MNLSGRRHAAALVLVAALGLGGCGASDDGANLAAARAHLAKGDARSAIIELRSAAQKNPDLPETRFLLGLALRRAADPAGAAVELQKALALGHDRNVVLPALAEALFDSGAHAKAQLQTEGDPITPVGAQATLLALRGDIAVALGSLDAARDTYESALQQDPGNERATLGLARLDASAGAIAKAEGAVAEVLSRNATSSAAWLLKAGIEQARGQHAAAIDAYARAIEAKPEDLGAHVALVTLLVSRGEVKDASVRLDAMAKIAPAAASTAYAAAMVSYAAGDRPRAREAIQAVLKVAPDDNRARLLGGIIEHDLGNHAMAQKLLTAVVRTAPGDQRARQMLASTLMRMGRVGEAHETLAPLLTAADPGVPALLLAGDIATRLHDPRRALAHYGKAIAIDPKRAEAWIGRARAHLSLDQFDHGIADLAAATKADPTQAAADTLMVETLLSKGLVDRAAATARSLAARLPDSPQVHDTLGLVAIARGDQAAARSAFQKAIALSPKFVTAVRHLAALELDAGNDDVAVAALRRLVALEPGQPDAILLLVRALQQTGAPAGDVLTVIDTAQREYVVALPLFVAKTDYLLFRGDAKGALDAALAGQAAFPDAPAALLALARAQQATGESRQALASYAKLASANPRSTLPLLGIAEVHAADKNWPQAREALLRAIQMAPEQISMRGALTRIALHRGDFPTARDDALVLQKKWPKRPEGYLLEAAALNAMQDTSAAMRVLRSGLAASGSPALVGEAYRQFLSQNQPEEAEKAVAAWLAKHADDARAMVAAGEVRQMRGEFKEAAGWFRRALEARPDDPGVLNNLAWALGQLGDADALAVGRRALALRPREAAILDTVGVLNTRFGDRDEGIRQLESAVARSPAVAVIRIHLAEALVQAGRKAEARLQVEEASRLKPAGTAADEIAEIRKSL